MKRVLLCPECGDEILVDPQKKDVDWICEACGKAHYIDYGVLKER